MNEILIMNEKVVEGVEVGGFVVFLFGWVFKGVGTEVLGGI